LTGDSLLSLAVTAAQLGGAVLQRTFRTLLAGDIQEKARNDWVSVADREAEEVIVSFLSGHTPEFGILAEERGSSGESSARWVIDPLDGTTNFVRSFPHFAVSIAFVDGGQSEVAAIYDPMRDELYSAQRGAGAWCNGRPLRVSGRAGLEGGFVTTGFPYRVHSHLDAYFAILRDVFLMVGAIRRPGAAALDLAHTAAGIFDGFFEFSLSPWDVAAGSLLVREAGGVVTNLDGGAEIFLNGNIVAGSPAVHRDLLSVVRRHCSEAEIVS